MHFMRMRGGWGRLHGWVYEQTVGAGSSKLYDHFVDQVVPEIPSGASIIDIGCGQGQISSRLARRLSGSKVLGLDLSEDMIRRAIDESPRLENLEFRLGNALALPLEDNSVDFAISVASIKHWPDRMAGAREILRVLKPRGKLCILECLRGCSFAESLIFADQWRLLPGTAPIAAAYFQHVVAGQALNLDELVGVLSRAGAVEIDARKEPGLPFVAAVAAKPAGQKVE